MQQCYYDGYYILTARLTNISECCFQTVTFEATEEHHSLMQIWPKIHIKTHVSILVSINFVLESTNDRKDKHDTIQTQEKQSDL